MKSRVRNSKQEILPLQTILTGDSPVVRPPAIRVHLDADEVIADNFAGGGGASSGIEWALGRSPDLAINHDPEAIAMHRANHPSTTHYLESVWQVDPVAACAGRRVALAWFSPDCKHFSKAKGTTPRSQKIRGLAWSAVRWATLVKPRVICLENVEEFKDWGPIGKTTGLPDKDRKGQTFRAFVRKLERAGYKVEWRLLRAHDFGAPTSRRRFFMIARCDGAKIAWPEPTHGPGRTFPYRTAAECIDWTIPVRSIFERERALSKKTEARIARGTRTFVMEAARPFIAPVQTHGGGGNAPRSIDEPLRTITTSKRGTMAIVVPYLVHRSNGERPTKVDADGTVHAGQAPRIYDIERPLGTIMAQGQKHALVTAFLAKHNGGNNDRAGSSGQTLNKPTDTVTSRDSKALTTVQLAKDLTEAEIERGLKVAAFLVRYNGQSEEEGLDKPLGTLTTRDRYGLVTVTIDGETYAIVDIGMRMLSPRELYAAQGFDPAYDIDCASVRDGKGLTKTAQVKMCGNSVPPPVSAAIVRSLFAQQPKQQPAPSTQLPLAAITQDDCSCDHCTVARMVGAIPSPHRRREVVAA